MSFKDLVTELQGNAKTPIKREVYAECREILTLLDDIHKGRVTLEQAKDRFESIRQKWAK